MSESSSHRVQVDIDWPMFSMFRRDYFFSGIKIYKRYAQLSSNQNGDARQPEVFPKELIPSIVLQYLFFAIPGAFAALYQWFFPAKTYYLEWCSNDNLLKYEENTLYFKKTQSGEQLQWCSLLQREWQNCSVIQQEVTFSAIPAQNEETISENNKLQEKNYENREEKSESNQKVNIEAEAPVTFSFTVKDSSKVVKEAIEKKLLPVSPTQKVWNTVRSLVRHEKTTYSSVAISLGVGIALAVGVAACCSGFGAPAGVALVLGALAVIGKSCGISLSVVAGSIALSRISSGLYWHRKSAQKTDIDKFVELSGEETEEKYFRESSISSATSNCFSDLSEGGDDESRPLLPSRGN